MKKELLYFLVLAGFLFICPGVVSAQTADSVVVNDADVIELTTAEIKIKIETPQIKLYSSRIKPEFDDIHLEKSFIQEITGLGESFEVKNVLQVESNKRIEIDKILKKLR